ncbi:hypothetical protein F444_19686 [Phytophthora nicotianae P1976]|uniref:Transcription activator GCR1-like domain-containing protein n=1 Tax=Phytophthora nicotianae P1976 TaxID=1317066 RepID=A0A080Z6X4_PHYNI|nr:hypothetical protein F444_19686 [Phytophthora nicotianae P1976]
MRKEFAAVHSQLFGMQRQIANVLNEPVARTIRRNPVSMEDDGEVFAATASDTHSVRLSKRPKDLYELWGEYEFGLNGMKAAREYTAAERGANNDVAVDRIYAIFGRQLPVTSILLALRRDKQQGGHPSLRL